MLSARVFRSHTVAVGITYARTLKSRQLLLKPQKNTAVTIGGIFLVEVTGLEPTTSWSLRRRWLCSTRRALCFRRILAAAPPLPEKMLRLFSGSPSFRVSALVLRPRGGSCPALSQKDRRATCSAAFLVEVTGLEPTTSWSLRRRWLCSTRRALCFRRILAAAPPLPEKMLRLFSGSPSFRVSALVLRPRGGSCPALSQKDRRATCSAAFLVEVTGLEPTTSWSLTKRATKLRYTSVSLAKQHILLYRIYKKCQAIFCLYLKNFQTERIFSKSLAAPQRSLRDSKNYRKQSDRTYQPKRCTTPSNSGLSP